VPLSKLVVTITEMIGSVVETNMKKPNSTGGNPTQDELSFTPIYHHLKGFKLIERAIYGEIKMRSDNFRERKCTASHRTIAKNIGAGLRSVERTIPEMIKKGMIKIVFQGSSTRKPNHYITCDYRQIGTVTTAKLVKDYPQFGGEEEVLKNKYKNNKNQELKVNKNKSNLPKAETSYRKGKPLMQTPPPVPPPPSPLEIQRAAELQALADKYDPFSNYYQKK
jgi:hypothetical protein